MIAGKYDWIINCERIELHEFYTFYAKKDKNTQGKNTLNNNMQ